jgi:hypothetical protein
MTLENHQRNHLIGGALPGPVSQLGTVLAPNYYEGLVDINGDQRQHRRYFTYKTPAGLMTGTTTSVMFTIDRPAKEIWPYFKDFNLWQNSYHHYYSGVVGDLEGKPFRITLGAGLDDPRGTSVEYKVERVIPQYLIVITQLVPEANRVGSMGGFMVFMLNEHEGQTVVTIMMQHDRLTTDVAEEEAIGFWRRFAPEVLMKWRDHFIPTLKRLVYGADTNVT